MLWRTILATAQALHGTILWVPRKKKPRVPIGGLQETEANSQHRKHSRSCVLEIIQAGRQTIPGRRASQVHLHSHSGHRKEAVRIGSWAFSLLCEFGQVTSLLWARGLDHIRRTPPKETLRDTLYTSETLGNKLTLQSHNFHLHYCNLGWCPTLFHKQYEIMSFPPLSQAQPRVFIIQSLFSLRSSGQQKRLAL